MRESVVHVRDGHHWRLAHTETDADIGLLWLPALGVPAAKYERFATALASQGVRVALHEWRGTGTSSWRASRRQDWGYRELLADDLPASLQQARRSLPDRPWLIGGHSLGGQLAALAATQAGDALAGLVLVASGVPDARTFSGRDRLLVNAFAASIGALTRVVGHYPGRQLGFADREAGGVMRDWSRTVRQGRYAHYGFAQSFDQALAELRLPVLALSFNADWLAPPASLRALQGKLRSARHEHVEFDDEALGERADHFRWMRRPDAVVDRVQKWCRSRLSA